MVLLNIFDIVGLVLIVQFQCLNVVVSNLVNVDSVIGFDGQLYWVKQVVFQVNVVSGVVIGGVKVVDVIESQVLDKLVYELGNLLVDVKGYVKMLNVDVFGEMVNIMLVLCSYQVNVEVFNMVKSMMLKIFMFG